MNSEQIVSKVNEYLRFSASLLAKWLGRLLPRLGGASDDWWEDCLYKLTPAQRQIAIEKGFKSLDDLDLAALLRIAEKSWHQISGVIQLPVSGRTVIQEMKPVRNTWAHCGVAIPGKDQIVSDLEKIERLLELLDADHALLNNVERTMEEVKAPTEVDFDALVEDLDSQKEPDAIVPSFGDTIAANSIICLVSNPEETGVVLSVAEMGGTKKYSVFIGGTLRTFYEGQIRPAQENPAYTFTDLQEFRSHLTSWQINHPSGTNLYSLNTARIDFVPYQFRPALKLIRADEPRILIADSVGVGKTIEAGLIIKELQARKELENILIICPKPLVSERKWELEMKRFDEEFTSVDGPTLRTILSDAHRDEVWPARYSRVIIPYSVLDSKAYEGGNTRGRLTFGLTQLDPPPHFDLVIVDEAHHIRNGSMMKEKAYDYKCVKYFCDHSDAVVMLTATPLQMGDQDLFTLLNVLRPDVITDQETFRLMTRPNEYITHCASAIRHASDDWQSAAMDDLRGLLGTEWGEKVTAKNPAYAAAVRTLRQDSVSREERIRLLSQVESLHSFDTMLNRTRRKDIQDFCIRRTTTLSLEFTPQQRRLHDELLNFETLALQRLHSDARSIKFMTTTLRRQAASCIFGLAPHIRDLISRRFAEMESDPDSGYSEMSSEGKDFDKDALVRLSKRLLGMADHLPSEDPKFDEMMTVIREKQEQDNNKIIIFSTFRYTLAYLRRKLEAEGLRVGQVDGSIKDIQRQEMRSRFEYDKDNRDALDILLFTEVGSEGLDYQFCNMMINYDLPWNPMKIEQRIGRIDRRGQQSDTVSIINIITEDTVDADIYYRCLSRIGVFEQSIGDCDAILGDIANHIEEIACDPGLTDEERQIKLEQMADNEVRRMQEMDRLEESEKDLFGIDLSEYTTAQEICRAENPWTTSENLRNMVEHYLKLRLGDNRKAGYIMGEGRQASIRLSAVHRNEIRKDLHLLPDWQRGVGRNWDGYLKGTIPAHRITFDADVAQKEPDTFFINTVHPLVRQAASYLGARTGDQTVYIHLSLPSGDLAAGTYYFSVYAWNYVGMNPHSRTVIVSDHDAISDDLSDILQEAACIRGSAQIGQNILDLLEEQHYRKWTEAKSEAAAEAGTMAASRIQTLRSNLERTRRYIENQIRQNADREKIVRMRQAEWAHEQERTQAKIQEIEDNRKKTDIHFTCMAIGVLDVT